MQDITLQQMLREYLFANRQIEPATKRKNERVFRQFMALFGTNTPAASVRKRDIAYYQAHLRNAGMAPSTVNGYCAAASSVFGWFVKLDELETNPFVGVGKLKVDATAVTYYEKDELDRLLSAIEQLRWRDPTTKIRLTGLFLTTHDAGLRIGEALNLRWTGQDKPDIDLDEAIIRIQYRPHRAGQWWEWGSKGHTDRTVPMGQGLLEHLYRMRVACPWLYPFLPAARCRYLQRNSVRLGDTIRNSPYSNLYRALNRVKERARIKSGRAFHECRRTAATELSEHLQPTDLQKVMGHKSFTTTLGYIGVRASRYLTDTRAAMDARST